MIPTCLTYFCVYIGNKPFDLKDFCEHLSLDYEYIKDYGTDVTVHIGENYEFDIDINAMLRKSLKDLFGKSMRSNTILNGCPPSLQTAKFQISFCRWTLILLSLCIKRALTMILIISSLRRIKYIFVFLFAKVITLKF